jgi:hypothetical protein
MALTFPENPSLNDETTTGGRTYSWNGQGWELVSTILTGPTGPTGSTGESGATGPTGSGTVGVNSYAASILFR